MLLLVHGGLWEDIGAADFWARPGVLAGLADRGHQILAPDRPYRAPSWSAEADALAALLPASGPVRVLAGSNGCSAALRLVLRQPDRFERLILAWPATAGDPEVDERQRSAFTELGASTKVADELLSGQTLRGVTDAELGASTIPVAVIPSAVDGKIHQWRTVEALCRLIPGAVRLPAFPKAPRPSFPDHLADFLTAVDGFLLG
jgi:pimeloyl-ACP methyl ester carboxylesterase